MTLFITIETRTQPLGYSKNPSDDYSYMYDQEFSFGVRASIRSDDRTTEFKTIWSDTWFDIQTENHLRKDEITRLYGHDWDVDDDLPVMPYVRESIVDIFEPLRQKLIDAGIESNDVRTGLEESFWVHAQTNGLG